MIKELRILNGTKKGLSIIVDEEPLRIGASLQSELVLSDHGVEENHLVVSTLEDNICLTADEGIVYDHFGEAYDRQTHLKLGIPFLLSDVWMVVQPAELPWPKRLPTIRQKPMESMPIQEHLQDQQTQPVAAQAHAVFDSVDPVRPAENQSRRDSSLQRLLSKKNALLVSILFFIFMAVENFAYSSKDKEALHDHTSNGDLSVLQAAQHAEQLQRQKHKQQSREALEAMLFERELKNITVNTENDDIQLTGNVSKRAKATLTRMLIRYHEKHSDLLTAIDKTVLFKNELPFHISSVVSGPFGHVITADGERLSLGQTKDGYVLVEISSHSITFDGQQRIEVSW